MNTRLASPVRLRLNEGARVRILDGTADCPSGVGTVVADMSQGTEEYEVAYNDGVKDTFGLFYRTELQLINR
jgi:hypothetical protein